LGKDPLFPLHYWSDITFINIGSANEKDIDITEPPEGILSYAMI